ncbi:DUF4239 domain-containing protein [Paraburkholderia phenazinium]|jgi:hypothetical protein|uniref:DUF4239 domain-containing protein n=1 Tax=Paraburkholderia phenazinium TaxID=60549 RepID=A0A1G7TM84_9BURK|nr:DUF4239 domain-containing protein [Paraburkholderia phenazinium]SDG36311.1 Protein of unknown function [Paraburkholderia phenazinium]
MLFLYNLPSAEMGALIVAATLAIALAGYALFRCFFPVRLDAEQRGMTIAMMSAVTTINSLLVAFSAISVWASYEAASDNVAAEAACATELSHDLASFRTPRALTARHDLGIYLQRVVHDEWPLMQQHARSDTGTEAAFDTMFAAVNQIEPSDDREHVLLAEVLTRVNEMVKYRQRRLQDLDSAMPVTLWGVMLIASGMSLVLLYALPGTRFNVVLVSIWATTLGLAFFFVLAVDRPFAGEVSVGSEPMQRALATLIVEDPRRANPPT